jgi:hypothetical protein
MGKQTLIKKIDALPPHLQQEVLDYADFLAQKYISRKRIKIAIHFRGTPT